MCWPHTCHNVVPSLKPIKTVSPVLAKKILEDIEALQWSVLNEPTFKFVFNLLENKYLNDDHEESLS